MSEKKNRERSEDLITEKIMRYFSNLTGSKKSFFKENNKIRFDFSINGRNFRCQTEKGLSYHLPNGDLITHNADIVITRNENLTDSYVLNPDGKFISIEIKHKSAVTDAFKARAYDMLHLTKEYSLCLGVMIYIREGNIKIEKAKEYCYPYHKFFGCNTAELTEMKIKPLFEELITHLNE